MKSKSTEYYLSHLSDIPADLSSKEALEFKKRFVLHPNQAIRVYNFASQTMNYINGFNILGYSDSEITMRKIMDIPIEEQREAVGELSGKALALAQESCLEPLETMIVLNYAGQMKNGKVIHLMVQSTVWETSEKGHFISAITTFTKLSHFKIPKIVLWDYQGKASEDFINILDQSIISPNRILNRELEVLTQISEGYTNKEIANSFNLSTRTIESHVNNMRDRFNCTNKTQLVSFAKDMNLL